MGSSEEQRENIKLNTEAVSDRGETETSLDSSTDGMKSDVIDAETIGRLRKVERNSVTQEGTVVGTMLVNYDAGATPRSVEKMALSKIAEYYDIEQTEAMSRLLPESRSTLTANYNRQHAYILVELPSEDVFVDRILVPENPAVETPQRKRYRKFVDQHGQMRLLSHLEGERVPISYDSTASGWKLDLTAWNSTTEDDTSYRLPAKAHVGITAVLFGLFTVSFVSSLATPGTPIFASISLRALLLTTVSILFVLYLFDLARTGVGLAEREVLGD